MWRVCATTVAHTQELEEYKQLFHDFLETDSLTVQRMVAVGSQGYSMRDFVEEVMRLHPPVKHIHRLRITQSDTTCPMPSFSLIHHIRSWIFGAESPCTPNHTTLESADIEAALRAQSIWSHDAHVFDPFRHRSASPQMNEAKKMVFGYGPLRCVAAAWAPDAAAVMSATILVECSRLGWNIVKGERIGGRTGWDGWKLEKREE
ncbi:hypothetical protein AN958_02266 [Leucoagaricus sp. SymC.cos]|nr:hypothetical protein AN958_02266 [Leucoagaricus sp. SymC.cos]